MSRIWQWLDDTKNWWAVAALALGVYQFFQAITMNLWTIGGWPRPSLIGAAAGIIFGAGHFAGKRWSRWFCVAWIVNLIVVLLINGAVDGYTAKRILGIIIFSVMAVACYFIFFRDSTSDDAVEDREPFLSLVLLLREPRYLDAAILAQLATRAWGLEVTSGGDSGEADEDNVKDDDAKVETPESPEDEQRAFIVGDSPLFIARHPSAMFLIHHFDNAYFDDLQEVADSLVELRTKRAVLEHRAWMSVDALHWSGEGDATGESYRLIARLLAELADENVLAVVDPAANQIFCYDPETERKLRSDDPRAQLREAYYAPVIEVPGDHPDMQAAVAEAQRRWPEFVAAFESRGADDDTPFAVKAPFGADENREFMWVEVTGIENEIVYGILKNEPAGIPELHEGDRVKVAVPDVNDWLAIVDDEPHGGFTIKVLAEQSKRPHGNGN